jgi:hypothetical protein
VTVGFPELHVKSGPCSYSNVRGHEGVAASHAGRHMPGPHVDTIRTRVIRYQQVAPSVAMMAVPAVYGVIFEGQCHQVQLFQAVCDGDVLGACEVLGFRSRRRSYVEVGLIAHSIQRAAWMLGEAQYSHRLQPVDV